MKSLRNKLCILLTLAGSIIYGGCVTDPGVEPVLNDDDDDVVVGQVEQTVVAQSDVVSNTVTVLEAIDFDSDGNVFTETQVGSCSTECPIEIPIDDGVYFARTEGGEKFNCGSELQTLTIDVDNDGNPVDTEHVINVLNEDISVPEATYERWLIGSNGADDENLGTQTVKTSCEGTRAVLWIDNGEYDLNGGTATRASNGNVATYENPSLITIVNPSNQVTELRLKPAPNE